MNEKTILLTLLSLSITSIILIVISGYNMKLDYDELLERWTIKWETLVDEWDVQTGRKRGLELRIYKLPKWLNYIFKSDKL